MDMLRLVAQLLLLKLKLKSILTVSVKHSFKTYNNNEIEAIINPPVPSANVVINSINGRTESPINARIDYSNGAAAGVIEWQYFFQ